MSATRPARWLERLAERILAADPHGDSTLGDLAEGYAQRRRQRGRLRSDAWYLRHALSIAMHGTGELDTTRSGPFEWVRQEIGVALRTLRRRPGFTLGVCGVLMAAFGAALAAFAVTVGTYEASHWWADEDRTVLIWPERVFSRGQLDVLRAEGRAFDAVGGMLRRPVILSVADRSTSTGGVMLSPELFAALRQQPRLGRGLELDDARPGAEPVVVIGHGLWQRSFGGDPSIVGEVVEVSGVRRRVVGVMPARAEQPGPGTEVWTPLILDPRDPDFWPARELELAGLLAPGVTTVVARDDVRRVMAGLARRFPFFFRPDFGSDATVFRSSDRAWGAVATPLLLLLAGTALLLLVAAIDVGNLVVARALERKNELKVRVALGASRWQVVRQILAESGTQAVIAAAGGWLIGAALARQVPALFPLGTPVVAAAPTSVSVVFFIGTMTLLSWLLVGGIPALHFLASTRADVTVRSRARVGAAGGLVIAQAALATALLITAALLLRSVRSLERLQLGFDPSGVIALPVAPPPTPLSPAQLQSLQHRIEARVSGTPNVEAAGWISAVPLLDVALEAPVNREDEPMEVGAAPTATQFVVDAGALAALRVEMVAGRAFTDADAAGSPPVIIINEALARTLWQDRDPVGRRIAVDPHAWDRWITVIGVVRDLRYGDLARPVQPAFYLPRQQTYTASMRMLVRSAAGSTAIGPEIRAAIADVSPDLPVGDGRALTTVTRDAQGPARVMTSLLSVLALLATALGAVGLHASLAGWVARRRTEIGTRLALGAMPRELSGRVLATGLGLTGFGVLIGSAAAALASRSIRSLLFGISPLDPVAFVAPAVLLLVVGVLAAAIPAVRAAAVAPAQALRDG